MKLIKPQCTICGSQPTPQVSKHIFLDLKNITPELKDWVNQAKKNWSDNAISTTNNWLNEGL